MEQSQRGGSECTASNSRKRQHDGVIVYYKGTPFCADLLGDRGGAASPMLSSDQDLRDPPSAGSRWELDMDRSGKSTELSGCSMDESTEVDFELAWTDQQQYLKALPFVACGMGGVVPDLRTIAYYTGQCLLQLAAILEPCLFPSLRTFGGAAAQWVWLGTITPSRGVVVKQGPQLYVRRRILMRNDYVPAVGLENETPNSLAVSLVELLGARAVVQDGALGNSEPSVRCPKLVNGNSPATHFLQDQKPS